MRVGTIQWKELLLSAAAGEGVILILAVIAYDSFFWMLPGRTGDGVCTDSTWKVLVRCCSR